MRPTTERTKRVSDHNQAAAASQKEDGQKTVPASLAHLLSPSADDRHRTTYPKRSHEDEDGDERYLLASPFNANSAQILSPPSSAHLQYSIHESHDRPTYTTIDRRTTATPNGLGVGRSPRGGGRPRKAPDASAGQREEGGWLRYEVQPESGDEQEDDDDDAAEEEVQGDSEQEGEDRGDGEEGEDGEDGEESAFEVDSDSANASTSDAPREFKRRKIKGTYGDCTPSDVGKIVFDNCESTDPKYRQPRMVIIADITKTASYKAIQFRSNNSLQKSGTSERYKDRTQSLLELLADKTIIWAKVLPAPKGTPEGGICGPCQHYGKECIVPLKKTSARDPDAPGYKILSICIHCKLYHTCDMTSSVKYMSFKPGNGANRFGARKGKGKVIKASVTSTSAPARSKATPSTGTAPIRVIDRNGLPPPVWHKSSMKAKFPESSSSRPTRTASAPTGPPPTRVSARIKERIQTEQLEADLGVAEDVSMSDADRSRTDRTGSTQMARKEVMVEEAEEEDGDAGPVESLRSFVHEMKRREKEKRGGKLDYPTRVMFERAEQDLVSLQSVRTPFGNLNALSEHAENAKVKRTIRKHGLDLRIAITANQAALTALVTLVVVELDR